LVWGTEVLGVVAGS